MRLKEKFDSGSFLVLAEIEPPKGVDVAGILANAAKVKGKVDAFVVTEMTNAVMRMSALGASLLFKNRGMEAVMQVCCRDRNRLALQADLLSAYACGIDTILAVHGEDPGFGDHHQAKAVYDIDLGELLDAIGSLQTGRDMAGIELSGAPQFLVGSVVKAGLKGEQLEREMETFRAMTHRGAEFFVIPPVFEAVSIDPFLRGVGDRRNRIIPTVLLLKSVGMARYIQRHMEHIHIPESLVARIQKAPDKVRECIDIAVETIRAFRQEGFGGVMVSTLGWEDRLPEILAG